MDRVYSELKELAIRYEIRPGTRLNEGELARRFGVSRTPVREALNRLTEAGFLSFSPSLGFFRRSLNADAVADLYEMREAIESGAVRLAAARATDEELTEIDNYLAESAMATPDQGVDRLVELDEAFHERIVKLTGNREMLQALRSINDRIRFFRWIDLESEKRRDTQQEHRQVLLALRERNADRAAAILSSHISKRRAEIAAQVREGVARIYLGEDAEERII